jgi:hypothetical protein
MSGWRSFPENAWKQIGSLLSGYGGGVGSYATAYALDTSLRPFINGRVSAAIRVGDDRVLTGAGVVARADPLYSFMAFYLVSDDATPGAHIARLAAFKHGKITFITASKTPIFLPNRVYQLSLQFFSGEVVGHVKMGDEEIALKHTLSEPPFPGHCGPIVEARMNSKKNLPAM